MKKLNLGAGNKTKVDYINIDKFNFPNIDLVLDLEKENLPFVDNSINEVFSEHFFEHIVNFEHLINEIYRVLKVDGILKFTVPSSNSAGAFQDPTHVRFFSPNSIKYLTNESSVNYFPKIHFKSIYIKKKRTGHYLRLYKLFTPLIRIFGKERFDKYIDVLFMNTYNELTFKLKKYM